MRYPDQAIEELINYFKDENTLSFNWLAEHNFKELTKLKEAIMGDGRAMQWFVLNGFPDLAAFVNAIWEDRKALDLLLKRKVFHWAACANLINGDEKAGHFLYAHKWGVYARLGAEIQAQLRKRGDEGTNLFTMGSPFK